MTADEVPMASRDERYVGRLRSFLAREGLVVTMLAIWVAAVAFAMPSILVGDTWLSFVDGRLLAQHGLPHHDSLTLWTLGRHWTDQQWLAHLALYELARHGLTGPLVLGVACVTLTGAILAVAARQLGSSPRSTALALGLPITATAWMMQARSQIFAEVLFAAVLALLVLDARRPGRRVLLVLPLLVVWANLHGSVALGAVLCVGYALLSALSPRTRRRSLILLACSPLCLLVSPYGFDLVRYYRLMLVNPPFAPYVVEWRRLPLTWGYSFFFASVGLVAVLYVLRRRALTTFEQLILPVLAAGSFWTGRNTLWFELAAVLAVPRMLDALLPSRIGSEDAVGRTNTLVAFAGLVAAAFFCTIGLVKAGTRLDRVLPPAAAAAVASAAGAHGTVLAYDSQADWLLWREPSLAGRVAYDVRFELLDRRELVELRGLLHGVVAASWRRCGASARVVTFAKPADAAAAAGVLARDARTVFSSPTFVVVEQPGADPGACRRL
jgi:hypothetical protein